MASQTEAVRADLLEIVPQTDPEAACIALEGIAAVRPIIDLREPSAPDFMREAERVVGSDFPVDDEVKAGLITMLTDTPANLQVRQSIEIFHGMDQEARGYSSDVAALVSHGLQAAMVMGQIMREHDVPKRQRDLGMRFAIVHDLGKKDVDIRLVHPDPSAEMRLEKTPDNPKWEQMQRHAELGFRTGLDMFKDAVGLGEAELTTGLLLVLTHHCHNKDPRRSPYPTPDDMMRLQEEGLLDLKDLEDPAVQMLGKYLAVADVYEAISAQRPYTKGKGFEDPASIEAVLRRSHPDMGPQIDTIMALHRRRYGPDGWIPVAPAADELILP